MRSKLPAIGMLAISVSLMAAIGFVSHLLVERFDNIEIAQSESRAAQV